MANNIVSEWLEDEIRLDYVDGTNYAQAMKARDFAATLDRLVEAADHLVNHPVTASCDVADSPLRTFNALDVIRLAAELAAIKLPESEAECQH